MTAHDHTVPGVAESLTVALDADPAATRLALERLDLTGPITRALLALDATDRFALLPTRLDQRTLGAIWRIDRAAPRARVTARDFDGFRRPGHVKVRWTLDLMPSEPGGSWLTIRTCLTAADEETAAGLRAGWGLVDAVSRVLVARMARAVRMSVDALEDWDTGDIQDFEAAARS